MKTCIFAPCYLDDENGNNELETYRFKRNKKWLDYMFQLQSTLHFEAIFLLDNASSMERLEALGGCILDENLKLLRPSTKYPNLYVIRFEKHYKREAWQTYHYWWRAMYYGWKTLPETFGYEKMIHIDTDMFVLSKSLVEYLNNMNSGFKAFYCKRHKFPESTFHVLCADSFSVTNKFIEDNTEYSKLDGKDAEHVIPFTDIIKDFNGDRFGEYKTSQEPGMDYFGQCPIEIEMKYDV